LSITNIGGAFDPFHPQVTPVFGGNNTSAVAFGRRRRSRNRVGREGGGEKKVSNF